MRRGDARCFDLCLGYPSERYSVFTLKLDGGDGADYAGHDDPKQQISHDKISLKKYGRALVAGAAGPSCVALRRAAGFRAKPGKTVLHAVACGLIRAIGSIFHNGIGLPAAMAAGRRPQRRCEVDRSQRFGRGRSRRNLRQVGYPRCCGSTGLIPKACNALALSMKRPVCSSRTKRLIPSCDFLSVILSQSHDPLRGS